MMTSVDVEVLYPSALSPPFLEGSISMQRLTAQGQQIIANIAQRYGVSTDAVITLLSALLAGHATMAQFTHPELGGSGQWMQGGMTMVGDMFNQALKAKVDGVCSELAQLLAQQPDVLPSMSSQLPKQAGRQPSGPEVSLFVPAASGTTSHWWPAALGMPSSSGAQHNLQYAYFPASRRLAIAINGRVTVYDTREHQISGVSQQQGAGASLTFSSQCGVVELASLPIVSIDGIPQEEMPAAPEQGAALSAPVEPSQAKPVQEDIITTIERLAALQQKGILSEAEFASTKAELLKRL